MAKRLVWSPIAKQIRKEILKYWILRNKSKRYSKKLNNLFENSAQQIADFPYSGIFRANFIGENLSKIIIYFIKLVMIP